MLIGRLCNYLGLQVSRIVSRSLFASSIAVDRLNGHISYRLISEQELLQQSADPKSRIPPSESVRSSD